MKRWWYLLFGLLLFFVSLPFDKAVSLFFVSLRNPFFDYIALFFSYSVIQVLIFLVIPFAIVWLKDRKSAVLFALSFGVVVLFSYSLKLLVMRPRPYAVLGIPLVVLFSYNFGWFNTSFPSSHASTSFSSFAALERFAKLKLFWLLLCIVVIFSRVYDGVHYLSDVVAGALLGYFMTVFVFWLDRRYNLLGKWKKAF